MPTRIRPSIRIATTFALLTLSMSVTGASGSEAGTALFPIRQNGK